MKDPGAKTILVVDDDEVIRKLLKRLLEKAGYEVTLALSGEKALEVLSKKGSCHLAILDIRMPHVDGVELLRRIRRDHPGLGTIAMSGYFDSEGILAKTIGDTADALLSKPFDNVRAVDLVHKVIEGRRG